MAADYTFPGTVDRVIDGDSIVATIVVADAFHERWTAQRSWRLVGCNAREARDPTGGGRAATDHLTALLPAGTPIVVHSIKVDAYTSGRYESARYDAQITLADGADLTELLIAGGWAAGWDGRAQPRPLPPWPRKAD